MMKNNALPVEDGKSKSEAEDNVKMKSKQAESGSESEKEVEEDLEESSNMGDSILQQLPISSTPAAAAHMGTSRNELTTETEEKSSQLFTSKLPAISKATLPPLSLPQAVTNSPVTNTTSLISSDNKTSTITSTANSVPTVTAATGTLTTNATTDSDKAVLEVKPSSEKETNPVGLVAEDLVKNGEDDEEQGDEKESSHSRLVTVTPLSHSLSSELSGTLSDDSMAVTPTESIDVSDSGMCVCLCAFVRACTSVYTYVSVCTGTYACVCVYIYSACTYICHTYIFTCTYICTVYTYVC